MDQAGVEVLRVEQKVVIHRLENSKKVTKENVYLFEDILLCHLLPVISDWGGLWEHVEDCPVVCPNLRYPLL